MKIRTLLLSSLLLAVAPTLAAAQGSPYVPGAPTLSPREAYAEVAAGKAVLVDIRTPEEWAETGVPKGAARLDMTAPDFVTKLDALRRANPGKDIAIICRTANRTSFVQRELMARGWTNIVNVRGGVAGRGADQGWKADGLPLEK